MPWLRRLIWFLVLALAALIVVMMFTVDSTPPSLAW